MPVKPTIFLSYSRTDRDRARNVERVLAEDGLHVWRDERSIYAGTEWSQAIERGIRRSRGLVVLLTQASAQSEWVLYEAAFAVGAKVPLVPVVVAGARVPAPLSRFQGVKYGATRLARKVDAGIRAQARETGEMAALSPKLVARFQEADGEIVPASAGRVPSLLMDLWVEQAPPGTVSVSFEILDLTFPKSERKWTIGRSKRAPAEIRQFLTDDMNSYGDVDIWAAGKVTKGKPWSIRTTLYEALTRYYTTRRPNAAIRQGLRQIRKH